MNISRLLPALLSLLLPLSLFAKDSPHAILSALPVKLTECDRGEIDSYGEPGLGESISYREGELLITVYLYDLGQSHVADGIEDLLVRKGYDQAKQEVLISQKMQRYSKVDLLGDGKYSPREGATMLRAQYHLTINNQQNGLPVYSEIYLFGARDHLVKLRCTCPREEEDRFKPKIEAFARALLDELAKL